MAPLVGHIAAGSPILAEQNIEDEVPVDVRLADHGAFCLRVHGDSMIEDGILDADIVVVDPSLTPRKGDVVAALVGDDATVKYFYPRGPEIELRPANSTMKPIVVPSEDVAIQGVVVSVLRRLK
jgi:repressor LexA